VSGVRYLHDVSDDNGQGGFYIADSPPANAVVVGNRACAIASRRASGCCSAMPRVASFATTSCVPTAPGSGCSTGRCRARRPTGSPARTWCATTRPPARRARTSLCRSRASASRRRTARVLLDENVVTGNHPTGDTLFAGGIVVASTAAFGGADPTENLVLDNHALGNDPADLVYDGSGSGNRLSATTAQPRFRTVSAPHRDEHPARARRR
jgi:hypothetical protein